VVELFPSFPNKDFTNLRTMSQALRAAGVQWSRGRGMPSNGLALMSGRQRYYSRHWIAVAGPFVYEVLLQMWLPLFLWRRDFLPVLAADFGSNIEDWTVEAAFEITGGQLQLTALFTPRGTETAQA